jgi:hypothetical protein
MRATSPPSWENILRDAELFLSPVKMSHAFG